ncbi:MBL fold metallo-hydrolase [Dendrosporobacter sp. 1207_IL3150]|uniref:MBL fold metallo-hydrolase n=1 Tax=Dendrosporobacter sp. 1207_IL3150 TaxID=3084054 RepID=UPI002FDA8170
MKAVNKIGRGMLFTFEDDITIYLIQSCNRWFLCDTHLGPLSMEYIKKYISQKPNVNDIVVFNTHSDWDHIWGNCAFKDKLIIGHETCRRRISEIGAYELEILNDHHKGNIELVLPKLTFNDRLIFEEDDIEFIYAPGHTIDSSICFDRKDSVLFVGDLVEYPIPYLDYHDLEVYIKTLEFIKSFSAKLKVSSHSGIIDNVIIDSNIAYIRGILEGTYIDPNEYQGCVDVHNFNINNRLFLKYENIVRNKLKTNFNYAEFRRNFGSLKEAKYGDLEKALELCLAQFSKC